MTHYITALLWFFGITMVIFLCYLFLLMHRDDKRDNATSYDGDIR